MLEGGGSKQDDVWLRELGADEVVDYTAEPVEKRAGSIDLALDLVGIYGGPTLPAMAPGGVLVSVAAPVRGAGGAVVAALSVVVGTDGPPASALIPAVVTAARGLSRLIFRHPEGS